MSALNCKPGQLATIVRGGCMANPCIDQRIGCPVRVTQLRMPATAWEALETVADGPVWSLESPLSCPCPIPCTSGIDAVPDRCLRPFDDGINLADDDTAANLPAQPALATSRGS